MSSKYFQQPLWIQSKNSYSVKPNISFIFNEIVKKDYNLEFPNINNDEIVSVTKKIGEKIVEEGKHWFASPIQLNFFLKKVEHTFKKNVLHVYQYGKTYNEIWKLKTILIFPTKFELEWLCIDIQEGEESIIPSDFLNFSEDLHLIEPSRTIVIQKKTNEVIENELVEQNDIEFENSEINRPHEDSRSLLKEKIKKAKIRLALAEMKLQDLLKKYFRLYETEADDLTIYSNSSEDEDE
jgi:hypothetical protein